MLNKKETAGETAMKVYTFNQFDHELRVGEINGEPWFVAKDVCASLGIKWSGKANTLAQIPEYWIGVSKFETPGGNQDLTVISEAGLYKLAFRCQSSEIADAFPTRWPRRYCRASGRLGSMRLRQNRSPHGSWCAVAAGVSW